MSHENFTIRPRWKRVVRWPLMVYDFWCLGCGLRGSIGIANSIVKY